MSGVCLLVGRRYHRYRQGSYLMPNDEVGLPSAPITNQGLILLTWASGFLDGARPPGHDASYVPHDARWETTYGSYRRQSAKDIGYWYWDGDLGYRHGKVGSLLSFDG